MVSSKPDSHISQEHPSGDAQPVAVPFLGFEAGEEEFPCVHEASEDFVAVTWDVAEFFSPSG